MAIKDLADEFIAAGNGQLHLGAPGNGCMLQTNLVGPDGKKGWQLPIFWGGHGASNKRFVVNPLFSELHPDLWVGRTVIVTEAIPPMGDLNKGAREAARAVLEAMK